MDLNCMDPEAEYRTRRKRWSKTQNLLQQRFIRIGNWRLAVALCAVLLGWLAFGRHMLIGWWLVLPVGIFAVLFAWHQGVIRRRTLAERAVRYYERGIERLRDEWVGSGSAGDVFRNPNHVYADDLDIFGKGSLFELLSTARTAAGERTLAGWLLEAASRDETLLRQEAIRELSGKLDLREDLALLGEDISSKVHAEMLEKWAAAPPVDFWPALRHVASIISTAALILLLAWLAGALSLSPFLVLVLCNFVIIFYLRKRVAQVIGAVETPARDLALLSLIIARLEQESFRAPLLVHLRDTLRSEGLAASKRIRRLRRWIELLDSSDHFLLRILGPAILWREQLAMALEWWRRVHGRHIAPWVRALGTFEALSSLATLAYERPQWTFPELTDGSSGCFEAETLRHPLIPVTRCIPNDVRLDNRRRLLIVSGSNMSGKSTLLRAVGLSTILAWSGAPVAAARLRISPLETGASIRMTDSLQDNRSRFFAEIMRIRQIIDLSRDGRMVLFLLDELLSGTNSHDRRIGASGIVRGLLNKGAMGLITTHDLALAEIEKDVGSLAANVHFEDRIADGKIEFDYRLRPGIVTHSNALELMRSVGLDV